VSLPEILRQFAQAGVEQVGVFQHLVVEIILSFDADRTCLDPHVDVFADEDDRAGLEFLLQMKGDAQDLVVRLESRKGGGEGFLNGGGLQE